jgi:hypothetical protein
MADATKRTVEKVRLVQEKYEEDFIDLTLTKEEAFVLYILLYRAGGKRSGPRGKLDSIRGALAKVGILWDHDMSQADAKVSGCPIFPDEF